MSIAGALLQILIMPFPWGLRRKLLHLFFGYCIDPTAHIGFSIIFAQKFTLKQHGVIGNLTLVKGLSELFIGEHGRLGNLNWVTGLPTGNKRFFRHLPNRNPSLIIDDHAAIHHRNLIDCSDRIYIGPFSRVAGWKHQLLTHSIDLKTANQDAEPLTIGKYCFIGTGAILLKGTALPDYSVLAAGSVLHKKQVEPYKLYSGVPAVPLRDLDPKLAFFTRKTGDSDQS